MRQGSRRNGSRRNGRKRNNTCKKVVTGSSLLFQGVYNRETTEKKKGPLLCTRSYSVHASKFFNASSGRYIHVYFVLIPLCYSKLYAP